MDQIKSHELKRLHLAANRGEIGANLKARVLELESALEVCEGKLRRERVISRNLRKKLKDK